jgi:hypothetical protein
MTLALVNDYVVSNSIVVFQVRATIWEMSAAWLSVFVVSCWQATKAVRKSRNVLGRWRTVWPVLLSVSLSCRNESEVGTWKDIDVERQTGAGVSITLSGGRVGSDSARGGSGYGSHVGTDQRKVEVEEAVRGEGDGDVRLSLLEGMEATRSSLEPSVTSIVKMLLPVPSCHASKTYSSQSQFPNESSPSPSPSPHPSPCPASESEFESDEVCNTPIWTPLGGSLSLSVKRGTSK